MSREDGTLASYVETAITGALRAVSDATQGTRALTLNREAFGLGGLIHTGFVPANIEEQLVSAATEAGLTTGEARATVKNSLQAGEAKPREIESRSPPQRHRNHRKRKLGRRRNPQKGGGAIELKRQEQPKAPAMEAEYPSLSAIKALWESCLMVWNDPDVRDYLTGRGIDPSAVTDLDLARALPPDFDSDLTKGLYRRGFRLIVPLYDSTGAMRSFIARSIDTTGATKIKSRSPKGYQRRGLIMADLTAIDALRGDSDYGLIYICEGEIDYLAVACNQGEAAFDAPDRTGALGVFAGSWTADISERIPREKLFLLLDRDPGGEAIREKILNL